MRGGGRNRNVGKALRVWASAELWCTRGAALYNDNKGAAELRLLAAGCPYSGELLNAFSIVEVERG